jgi:dTDP-4-amino-4,6-dideoxygalactose transaminase
MLKAAKLPSVVYYPIPLTDQKGYAHFPSVSSGVNVSKRLANTVLSLPMHPYLEHEAQDYIIKKVRKALEV